MSKNRPIAKEGDEEPLAGNGKQWTNPRFLVLCTLKISGHFYYWFAIFYLKLII